MPIQFQFSILAIVFATLAFAQVDRGARPGPPAAGGPLPGLSPAEMQAFATARAIFEEVTSVAGGLGPRFNGDSCSGCHAQPSSGGSSPARNPQFAMAARAGAGNLMPAFLQEDGPIRIVRQAINPDGTPAGGVLNLFTIAGRSDAPGCTLGQPDFSPVENFRFRIPTPVYGLGLMEAIPDSTLRANLARSAEARDQFGIKGHFNTSGNDGTITRFGWKAQNKSLLIFAGEAYHVEQGVTNEVFPNPRDEAPGCGPQAQPEDHVHSDGTPPDVPMLALFMRLLDQPRPAPPPPPDQADHIDSGRRAFDETGCVLCHTPVLRTGSSTIAALSNRPVDIFSDLALHDMGTADGDSIMQGSAGTNEFRTAPLWGLGQRVFFMHDGRTKDLMAAIAMHSGPGSEGARSVAAYDALPVGMKQDLLDFLRSL